MQEFIRSFATSAQRAARQEYVKLFGHKGKIEIIQEAKGFLEPRTLYKCLSNIIYGHIWPELKKIDDIRLSVWIKFYGMDAAESTIPLKFGRMENQSTRRKIQASANHICCDWGYNCWYIRFLEKAGEKYEVVLVEHLASCIARNMQLCKKCPDFYIKLSIDTGSECNVDIVRNCLCEGISKILKIKPDGFYRNQFGVEFSLKNFRISVKSFQSISFPFIAFHSLSLHFIQFIHRFVKKHNISLLD